MNEAQHVLVVGGGPVGLEAAHRLADAGHRVTLWEAAERLGGTLTLAGTADPALAPLADWLAAAAERSGVEVVLGRAASAGAAAALGPDRVLVAVGAGWSRPGEAIDPEGIALTPDDLWADPSTGLDGLGQRVVVVGSGKVAVSLAAAARARGREVALVSPEPVLAPELGLPGRFRWVDDLRTDGVELHVPAVAAQIGAVAVVLADGTGLDADTVLWAIDRVPRTDLADALAATGIPTKVIGDASGTYGLESGLADAARTATALGRVSE